MSALEDELWCPMFEEASDALQEHEKRKAKGKALENPSSTSFWEDIVSERKKKLHNISSPIYSKYDWKYFIIESRVLGPWRQ